MQFGLAQCVLVVSSVFMFVLLTWEMRTVRRGRGGVRPSGRGRSDQPPPPPPPGRFPSVEERVKVYMSNWYNPPCVNHDRIRTYFNGSAHLVTEIQKDSTTAKARDFVIQGFPPASKKSASIFYYNETRLVMENQDPHFLWHAYSQESVDSIGKAITAISSWDGRIPIILQFGDTAKTEGLLLQENSTFSDHVRIPIIKKIRRALSREERQAKTAASCVPKSTFESLEPIVWKLTVERHYGMLPEVPPNDRAWHLKKNQAVFRGCVHKDRSRRGQSDEEYCLQSSARCRLVYTYAKSTVIDAKLTGDLKGLFPSTIQGIEIQGPRMEMTDMLSYKGIIILEGNDVASGLKWALYSQSVVLMPPPALTSWAMEELLVPWVHYIPLAEDLSDVEDQVQWMMDHDEESQEIAQRGFEWIYDLVFRPQAQLEDEMVEREILRRYAAHFEFGKGRPLNPSSTQ